MKINEPNELMGLFFKYRLKEIPVLEEGNIRGSIKKSDLVKRLRKSEHFSRNILQLMDELIYPADETLLNRLRKSLKNGEISGLPLLNRNGEIQRIITSGVMEAEEKSGEFLAEVFQRTVYEKLISGLPFPVVLCKNSNIIYKNKLYEQLDVRDWESLEFSVEAFKITFFMPSAVQKLQEAFLDLENKEPIPFRKILEEIEKNIMITAKNKAGSTSGAAKMVDLPRQTFNYRWSNFGYDNH
ncbi:MAG: hypothetical protein ACLFN5_06360 [bacterium]